MPVTAEERMQYVQDMPEMAAQDVANAENCFKAITIYCEGVMIDFPETATWMSNIIILAKKGLGNED